ncbi:hypothetical protein BJX61DRAFT_542870 [Aspergillus egyptiacus]|nr:hypothetical protein BJX61DRAFT_542870 [Aspergillus egyptiacus]
MAPPNLDTKTLAGGIVNLTVGASRTPFDTHIELLCDRSPYFNEILSDRYENPRTMELVLEDVDPDIFAELLRWMYCGQISPVESTPRSSRISHLYLIWILAERFRVRELQRLAMAQCKEFLQRNPDEVVTCGAVMVAYAYTGPGSPLRRHAVKVWVERAVASHFEQAERSFLWPFLEDVDAALRKRGLTRTEKMSNGAHRGQNEEWSRFHALSISDSRPPRDDK